MAPREEVESAPSHPDTASPDEGTSSFWSRVAALPALKTAAKTLVACAGEKHKAPGLLVDAVTQASTQLSAAMTAVTHTFPEQAEKLDKIACRCLDVLEDKCPAVQQPVAEVIDGVKTKSNSVVKDCTRYALKSSVGKPMFKMLNNLIDLSESALHALLPPTTSPVPPEVDEGVEVSDDKPKPSVEKEMLLKKYVGLAISVPLVYWIKSLKRTRNLILQLAGKKCPLDMTPNKKAEIEKRRKLSPKKRIRKTFTQQLVSLIFHPVNKYCSSGMPFAFVLPESFSGGLIKQGSAEKRKHDDLSDDEEEEEDLYDLDNYVSDDDPDYEPSEHGSTDSLEYQEGDTESDIETEAVGASSKKSSNEPLEQIKEKEGAKLEVPPDDLEKIDEIVDGKTEKADTVVG